MNSTLQKLDCYETDFGDEGTKALCDALKVNSTLQELSIFDNDVGVEGTKALCETSKKKQIFANASPC